MLVFTTTPPQILRFNAWLFSTTPASCVFLFPVHFYQCGTIARPFGAHDLMFYFSIMLKKVYQHIFWPHVQLSVESVYSTHFSQLMLHAYWSSVFPNFCVSMKNFVQNSNPNMKIILQTNRQHLCLKAIKGRRMYAQRHSSGSTTQNLGLHMKDNTKHFRIRNPLRYSWSLCAHAQVFP